MSAGSHEEGHDDQPLHQAPWVFFATVGACFGFLTLLMFAKTMVAGISPIYLIISGSIFVVMMGLSMWPATHP